MLPPHNDIGTLTLNSLYFLLTLIGGSPHIYTFSWVDINT